MKVSELITALQAMPQDARVILTRITTERWDNEVRDVCDNTNIRIDHPDYGTVELDNWPAEGFLEGQKA